MKKKWIVIPSLLVLAVIGAVATKPMWSPRPAVVLDDAMRLEAIDTLVAKLNAHYVFPDKARQIEVVLRQRLKEGKYDAITDADKLSDQLSEDIDGVAHDKHMTVFFSPEVLPPDDAMGPPPATRAEWEKQAPLFVRLSSHVSNMGLEKVDHLGPNIGYLEFSSFAPDFLVSEKYASAMNKLADTDGLIIDLRKNGGGVPQTVTLLASYLVDQRTRLNDIWERKTGTTTQQWTLDKLDGKRYGGKKPVIILVGPGTKSAGEDFAYTMQALKRATVIGENTWGGAHPARRFRLGDHLLAVIPWARTISPITQSNWEGVGVTPDVAAKPDRALEVAKEQLQRQLKSAAPLVAAGQ